MGPMSDEHPTSRHTPADAPWEIFAARLIVVAAAMVLWWLCRSEFSPLGPVALGLAQLAILVLVLVVIADGIRALVKSARRRPPQP